MEAFSSWVNSNVLQSSSERVKQRTLRLQHEFAQMKRDLPKGVKFRFDDETKTNFGVLLPQPVKNSSTGVSFHFFVPDRYPLQPPRVYMLTGPEVGACVD
jgi:ubiquitin-protein ligase